MERDDPTLADLRVSSLSGKMGFYYDLARIGETIGWNTNLRTFIIGAIDTIPMFSVTPTLEYMAHHSSFFSGLKHNYSIRSLHLLGFDFSEGGDMKC